jgi:glutathione-regulated potassium-efflux system ancillary protein KefF
MTTDLRALVVFADPSLHRSRISRRVAEAVASLPGVQVVDLYQRYPDFYIDVRRERELLKAAPLVLFVFQLGWYAMPALLKEWFDTVFKPEWALEQPGRLQGKGAWVGVACNSLPADYAPGGRHGRPLVDFLAPIEQTAKACGMRWLEPHVFYGADGSNPDDAAQHAGQLRALLARHAGIDVDAGGAHGA